MLRPPSSRQPGQSDEAGRYTVLWLSLAAVLVLGLVVVLILPRFVATPVMDTAGSVDSIAPGEDAAQTANDLMQAYLQLQARLELEQAPQWGEPHWSQAAASARRGSRLMAQRQFEAAVSHYEQALQTLRQLEGGREQHLATLQAEAEAALANNEVIRAMERYEQMLVIDPANAYALNGLQRAELRITVLEHMARGEAAEAKGDLQGAQAAYQEAALLEPGYQPPAIAFQRVTGSMEDSAFQRSLSIGLITLKAGRFDRAQKALDDAAAMRPDDPAVLDAQQRLEQAQQNAAMDRFRRQTENMVKNENWQGAINVYGKALAVDPAAAFAISGLEQAESRLALNQQFDHYLNQPERLYAPEPLANAQTLLASTPAAPPEEPGLAKKIDRLGRLVAAASTPVTVNLSSDGETDVTIYHVGSIGLFTDYELELLPGTYTVVGSRYGYRDVMHELKVIPGAQQKTLSIRCEEPI